MDTTLSNQLAAAKILAEELRRVIGEAHSTAAEGNNRFAEISIMDMLKQAVILERVAVELAHAARV
jgi:hypothetical protein